MGDSALSPAKALLLAVHFAAHVDIDSLRHLAAMYPAVFRKQVLLRILLTYLPETAPPSTYVKLLEQSEAGSFGQLPEAELDLSPVDSLSEHDASQRAKKLHLAKLSNPDAPAQCDDDVLALFLYQRALRMDAETGMLSQLLDLLVPFIHHSTQLRTWTLSTVLPFVRRNAGFYAEAHAVYSLADFQKLPGPEAVGHLLSRIGTVENSRPHDVARDIRGLVMPWVFDPSRWTRVDGHDQPGSASEPAAVDCAGWERLTAWLASQATDSWRVFVSALEHWGGPTDIDFGRGIHLSLPDNHLRHLSQTYARAAVASIYSSQVATEESLGQMYRAVLRIRSISEHGQQDLPLADALAAIPCFPVAGGLASVNSQPATCIKNYLPQPWGLMTSVDSSSTCLLMTVVLSALISTRLGVDCSVKRAAELVFLRDERDQKAELAKLLRAVSNNAPRDADQYWLRARRDILWLRNWGQSSSSLSSESLAGLISTVPEAFVEGEMLKALLSNSRFSLATSLYEDGAEKPLPTELVQEAVYQAALGAFDNASNPNRSRGGLKKCDHILNAFPRTMYSSLPAAQRVRSLVKATHALSDYRLVLKQGEPFSPVVLRVHSDPITIIGKVLEQNPKAYTRVQEFLEMAMAMVRAGLPSRGRPDKPQAPPDLNSSLFFAEKRVVAMCIEAALREHDFETAYSYVVSRLGASESSDAALSSHDEWSWRAAQKAGQYARTEQSQQPTHLGTASGNLEIRHLEQRIECLAVALILAPTHQLQEILKSFRRCEEQLDSAVVEEAASEATWEAAENMSCLPGAFHNPNSEQQPHLPRNMPAVVTARQTEEAPMSLFDLSRATARAAQRNLTGLSRLRGAAVSAAPASESDEPTQRVRKRDQLRDAATGTLVSGVGWLIGANAKQGNPETREPHPY